MQPRYVVVALCCAAIGAGVAVWRSGLLTERTARHEQAAQSQLTQMEFKRAKTLPMSLEAVARIERQWNQELKSSSPAISSQLAQGISAEAAMWLNRRFINQSPAEYRAWRHSLGYRLQDRQTFILDNGLDVVYPALVHQQLPSNANMDVLFDTVWPTGFTVFGDDSMPVAIATDDIGAAVAVTLAPLTQFASRNRLSSQISAEHWMGYGGATMRTWFNPPFAASSCADPHGNTLIIELGVLVEYKSGNRRPLVQTYAVSPAGDRWVLMGVTTYAADSELISALEY